MVATSHKQSEGKKEEKKEGEKKKVQKWEDFHEIDRPEVVMVVVVVALPAGVIGLELAVLPLFLLSVSWPVANAALKPGPFGPGPVAD